MMAFLFNFIAANTISGVFSYTFAIPYFAIGMVLLAFGVAYMVSGKVQIAILLGLITSITLTLLAPDMINVDVSGIFGLLEAISIVETTFKNRHGVKVGLNENEND